MTGKSNWGPHSYYVALLVETGVVGSLLFALFLVWVFRRLHAARALGRALAAAGDPLAARVRPLAWGCTAALAGTLASNAFYLTMQFYYFYVFLAFALSIPVVFANARMKVVVLTTSYPRSPDDVAGRFVADAVERARAAGVDGRGRLACDVPALRHRLRRRDRAEPAGGAVEARARAGVSRRVRARSAAGRARRRPGARPLDPVGARGARDRQAVRAAGVGDGRRARPAGCRGSRGRCCAGARLVLAASSFLAGEAEELGARRVSVSCRPASSCPQTVAEPAEPPHVLYAGRLSEEKGILEFVEATTGLPRVIVGDGPLRARVPDAVGFVPPAELGAYYERAAIVCVPSRREGYGMTAREAMAYGRPVVATARRRAARRDRGRRHRAARLAPRSGSAP